MNCLERNHLADELDEFGRWSLDSDCITYWPILVAVAVQSLSPVRLLCDSIDYSPTGSSVHGISQAAISEWVASFSFGELPDPGIKPISCIGMCVFFCFFFFTTEPPGKPFYQFLLLLISHDGLEAIKGSFTARNKINKKYKIIWEAGCVRSLYWVNLTGSGDARIAG